MSIGPNGPVSLPAKSFSVASLRTNLEAALAGLELGRADRVKDAIVASVVGAVPQLGPTTATFSTLASAGADIVVITGVPAGVTPTFSPNDGRIVVGGSELLGWKLVVGLTASTAGAINGTINATGATSANIAITVTGAVVLTEQMASRLLAQGGLSANPAERTNVVTQGIDQWIESQFLIPRPTLFWDWLVTNGYTNVSFENNQSGWDGSIWNYLYTTTDHLRARVGLALSSFLVIGINGLAVRYQQFQQAHHFDVLWNGAFGNYRELLEGISREKAMAVWLTFNNSKKANLVGSQADENYAREIMQLFGIGLYQLNMNGTKMLDGGGVPLRTYNNDDVGGLAKVYTGYSFVAESVVGNPAPYRTALDFTPGDHDVGTKTFLGQTLPSYATWNAATPGTIAQYADAMLEQSLDVIFNHSSCAPFVAGHLIRNLVTENPSPAYVGRVAAKFANNGLGVRGDMKAVIQQVMLDTEARDDATALASTTFGRLMDPILRHAWISRMSGVSSPNRTWEFGYQSAALTRNPGRSPSVFNDFKADHFPPNSAIQAAGLIAPVFGIVNETNVAAYANFMLEGIQKGFATYQGRFPTGAGNASEEYAYTANPINPRYATKGYLLTFAPLLAVEPNTDNLLAYLNIGYCRGQMPPAVIAALKTGLDSYTQGITFNDDLGQVTHTLAQTRVRAALLAFSVSQYFMGVQ